MRECLEVDFRKWPDSSHWHFTVYPLGEDRFGRWFHLPTNAQIQRGAEPPQLYPGTSALLFPEDAWWAAVWNTDTQQPFELYIDVATPSQWRPGKVTLIDLDLDVVRTWQGDVQVLDRDEFELHQNVLKYPDSLIQGAERSAQVLTQAVERREEPFDQVGAAWLAQARAQEEA